MKILFIAPYRQNDEWGDSSRNYIMSLLLTGHDITIRPIFLGTSFVPELSKELLQAEQKKYDKYDVVIQKSLPHAIEYNGHFNKNIVICTVESIYINSGWVRRLNLMDEIWVTSNTQKEMLNCSGITKPIKIIGAALPTDIFTQQHEPLDIVEAQDTFNFYYIGEHSERSNLTSLIISFHSVFRKSDNVRLILNTGASRNDIHNLLADIKKRLRIYKDENYYKKDVIITPLVNNKYEPRLHTLGHCFVLPSCGEAFQKYAVNAVGFNNIALVCPSMKDFVPNSKWVIDSNLAHPCIAQSPLPDLYTGKEVWDEISTYKLGLLMKQIYQEKITNVGGTEFVIEKCSYQSIANNINQALQ